MSVVRTVLIDDDQVFCSTMRRMFRDKHNHRGMYALETFESIEDAARDNGRPDVILLDLGLEASQGMDTIRHCKGVFGDTPLVVLTGGNGELEALEHGAAEFLLKSEIAGSDCYEKIISAIDRAIARTPDGERWLSAKRRMHDTNERLDAGMRKKHAVRNSVVYGVPFAVIGAVAAFLITTNLVAVLPGKADGADLKAQVEELGRTKDRVLVVETNMQKVVEVLSKLEQALDAKTAAIQQVQATQATQAAVIEAKLDYFMRKVDIDVPSRDSLRRGHQ